MKRISLKKRWIICGAVLAALLAVCAWMYGWGRGDIDLMDFDADAVDRIELYSTAWEFEGGTVVSVTEKEDIQALIDLVNSFQHTGTELKFLLQSGVGVGGSVLYEFRVYLLSGEDVVLCFTENGRDLSDMEMTYSRSPRERMPLVSPVCRGSLELFYDLREKYM